MKNRLLALLLAVCIALCTFAFVGCDNTNDDRTAELSDGLIESFKKNIISLLYFNDKMYFNDMYEDWVTFDFSSHINNLKNQKELRLVKISSSDYYYAVAYYNSERDLHEVHNDFDNFTWVGYKNASDITEYYNEQKMVVAVQVNRSSYYESVVTEGELDDISVEQYQRYNPEFKNGKNTAAPILYESAYFFTPTALTSQTDGVCYCFTHGASMGGDSRYKIVDIDGELYMSHVTHSIGADGKTSDVDLNNEFGDYYDELMEIMITDKYSEPRENGSTVYYGLFKIEDIVNLVNQ